MMPTPKLAAVIAALGMLSAGRTEAQNMSADQIIRSLRPTAPSGPGRGIRPMGPSANTPAEPPAATSPAPHGGGASRPSGSVQAASPAPSVDLTVQFATGSAELTPAATRTLDELGRALSSSALSEYRFRIEGHTDTVGTREHNLALSEARAAKVLDYLAGKWSVERSKVTTVGMGQEHLAVPTGPGIAQPRNRRVTVINLGT